MPPSISLRRMVTEADQTRILIVCAARPALHARRPAWQAGEHRHQRIDLVPLRSRDSRRLVAEILHKVHDLPDDLRETIVAAAEGNPFHIEELVKMLIEDGVIVRSVDAWRVARRPSPDRSRAGHAGRRAASEDRRAEGGPEVGASPRRGHRAQLLGPGGGGARRCSRPTRRRRGLDRRAALTRTRLRSGVVEHRRRHRVRLQARRAPRGRLSVGVAPVPQRLPCPGGGMAEFGGGDDRAGRRVRGPHRRPLRRRRASR